MSADVIMALHRLRWLLAAETMQNRLALLATAYKANFDPNQPRVPRGNPDGGQWTSVGGGVNDPRVLSDATPENEWIPGRQYAQNTPRGPRGAVRPVQVNGRWVLPTSGQATRLDIAQSQARAAVARVQSLDPNWRPTPSAYESVEGLIAATEATARQAQARFDGLRSGIGGNFGPPLTPAPRSEGGTASRHDFNGPAWIRAYRESNRMPNLFGQDTWSPEDSAITAAEIDGLVVFGVNSTAPTYTSADRVAAQRSVDSLIKKYPRILQSDNIGWKPNDALYHAEATILLRVAHEYGGTLAGRTITVHVDKEMCTSCMAVMPKLGRELGNPVVTYIDAAGIVRVMRDGAWVKP